MQLIYYPNKVLKTICSVVEDPTAPEIIQQIEEMTQLLHQHQGLGLAASQVGITNRIFVIEITEERAAFINPVITEFGEETVDTIEGCLSLPGVTAKLKIRSRNIKIEAYNTNNEKIHLTLRGNAAVVCQHELDHLNGITLFDRMPRIQKMMQLNKYNKRRRRFNEANKKRAVKKLRSKI